MHFAALFCLLLLGAARGAVWLPNSAVTLLSVVQRAEAGDTIELEAGDYVLSGSESGAPALHIDKPLTLRSRDASQRAVLRGNNAEVLLAITSSAVTLRDLVVGRQVSGGDERHIDVYVASGSQALPASQSTGVYGSGTGAAKRTLASRGALLSARAIQTSGAVPVVSDAGAQRALHDVRLINVEFASSRSGTNVAFASGAYAGVALERCSFGRPNAAHINAIVAVGDAWFDALRVRHCVLRGDAHVLIGSSSVDADALALNYWGGGAPQVWLAHQLRPAETYCLDATCTHYAPVVNGDSPQSAYASLEAAVAANVRHIRIADDVALRSTLAITLSGTVIEGGAGVDGCGSTPLLSVHAGGAVVSSGGALRSVHNVRVALVESGATAFVFSDGAPQLLAVARHAEAALSAVGAGEQNEAEQTVYVSGVSMLGVAGASEQAALVINAAHLRAELTDSVFVDVAHGAVVQRGALAAQDVTVSGASRVAFYAETATHEAALRVSGCTVIGGDAAVELGAGASSAALLDFGVSCSQFLFGARRVPVVSADCASQAQRCASALHYNTIVSAHAESAASDSERAMLRAGANYVEYGQRADEYVYAGEPRSRVALAGRTARVQLHDAAGALFLVVSYAALSSECLPVGETTHSTPQAAVVSGTLEVRSDALLHECGSSVAVRFGVASSAQEPAVFGVARIGVPHRAAEWAEQASSVASAPAHTLDVSATLVLRDSADNRLHRSVVLAQNELTQDERAALEADALPTSASRTLCVVCDADIELSEAEVELYCNNDAGSVRSSFDAAYNELQMGGRADGSVALLIAGECVLARSETVLIGNHEHIGRLSPDRDASLVRIEGGAAPLVRFAGDAASSSLRHISLRSTSSVDRCAVHVALSAGGALGPTIDSCTLDGSLCVEQRYGGHYTSNKIGGTMHAEFGTDEPEVNERVVFERNQVFGVHASVVKSAGAIVQVAFVDNEFTGAHGGLDVSGSGAQVRATNNKRVSTLHASAGARLVAYDNVLRDGASINLSGKSALSSDDVALVRGANVRLSDTARISNVHFDVESVVLVDSNAAVVLRNVQFDKMSTLCATDAPCHRVAISAQGVDLIHSRILNADNNVVLEEVERSLIAGNPAAYWSASAQGAVTYCADDAQVFVYHASVCGCGAPGDEEALRAADNEQPQQRGATSTHHTGHTGVPTILWVLLITFFVCITCCVLIGLCVPRSDDNAQRKYSSTQAAMAHTTGAQYLIGSHSASSGSDPLAALRVRKPQQHSQ